MLRVPVPSKVDLALKPFAADATGKGFVAAVLPHVGDQVRRLAEGLAADDAFVRFLT